jgi:hypothetical protein
MNKKALIIAALFAAAAGSGVASAGTLQLDLNSLAAQAVDSGGGNTFGLLHTGSVNLSHTAASNLADILLDGVASNITPGQLVSFAGQINLVAGQVTGGNFDLMIFDGSGFETFMASIVGGQGQVNLQAGQGYSIDGLITSAMFSSDPFAGVVITPWFSNQPLDGSFIEFAFNPNAVTGYDANTNLDIFVVIPSPLAGGMAGIGLMGLAARRRRA